MGKPKLLPSEWLWANLSPYPLKRYGKDKAITI